MLSGSHIRDNVALVQRCLVAVYVHLHILTLLQRYIVPRTISDIVLSWSNDLVLWIVQKLVPVSKPSCDSGNHEQDGEHISWETHGLVDDSTIEVDIRVEFSFDKVRIAQCNSFEFDSDFNQFFFSSNFEHLVCNFFD